MKIKTILTTSAASLLLTANSQGVLVIAGLTDGDLSGGNPKSIILTAAAPIADLSVWGIGSANNGGGSDGEEFTFPAISLNAGDAVVVTGNPDSTTFFTTNFVQNFQLFESSAALINGDDAVELFQNGVVFDTYGDINTNGDGETWDYTDGFATRTGGLPGAFDQANYSSNAFAFDGLDEQQHIAVFEAAGFTAIPEPSGALLLGLGLLPFLRRRR